MTSNEQLFERAQRSIPGGVNSPVRAFRSVGGTPRFIERAAGPYFWDAEGTRYIDYIGSWGPMILGHAHAAVVRAIQDALPRGISFGAPTEAEVEMAEALIERVPSMQQVRLVSSGTEAAMSAIRLATRRGGRRQPAQDHQVRGLLSRPRRQLAGQSRLRAADLRSPQQCRCAGRDHAAHAGARLQRRAATAGCLQAARRRHCMRHRRANRRQHEPGACDAEFLQHDARAVQRTRRIADLRRSDVGISCCGWAARRRCTGSIPTSRCSAR